MYRIVWSEEAAQDFQIIVQKDKTQAGVIYALIEELDRQEIPPDRLLSAKERKGNYEIKIYKEAIESGLYIWILKIYWGFEEGDPPLDYRVFFAPNHRSKSYCILGIEHRGKSYGKNKKIYDRIYATYQRLGCNSIISDNNGS